MNRNINRRYNVGRDFALWFPLLGFILLSSIIYSSIILHSFILLLVHPSFYSGCTFICLSMSIHPVPMSRIALHDVWDDPLFSVWNIDDFRDFLDPRTLVAMRVSGYAQVICNDWHRFVRDTAARAGKKRWWHWGGCGTSELAATSQSGLAVCSRLRRSRRGETSWRYYGPHLKY